MTDTTSTQTANGTAPATLPKREVQDAYTPAKRGRPNEALALWSTEVAELLTDPNMVGKVAAYPGVKANVATTLRTEFPKLAKSIKMVGINAARWLDKDGKPTDDIKSAASDKGLKVENPAYNTGRLEILCPDELGAIGDGRADKPAEAAPAPEAAAPAASASGRKPR